ncbi:MAG TPA: hypothetical protein VJ853_05840 [Thermoanaerobaculia bacterium]|nr:hypothetical protein [Thermoanaerobaculia bacterium]
MIFLACAIALSAPSPLTSVLIASSGKVAAGFSRDHKLRVWTLPDDRLLSTVDVAGRVGAASALSNDGRTFVLADYNNDLTIWDTATGAVAMQEHLEHYPLSVAFARDDRLLALGFGTSLRVIDLGSHKTVLTANDSQAGVMAIAFSRDGSRVATAEGNASVRVRDAKSGSVIAENRDFLLEPLAIDFSADGKQVIAGGGDSVLVFIDATTGKTLRRSAKLPNAVFDVRASQDGRELAVLTLDANDLPAPSPILVLDTASLEEKMRTSSDEMLGGAWTVDGHLVGAKRVGSGVQLVTLR